MFTKTTKAFFAVAVAGLMMTACGDKDPKALLEGRINVSEPTELTFLYDINGDVYAEDVTTDSTGVFVFNPELQANEADIAIYTGHNVYGAFVEKGKSVSMEINGDNVTFTGDNVDRNEFVNAYEQAYSIWKFKPTPDRPFVYETYVDNLEDGYKNATSKLAAVKDDAAREIYSRRNEARNNYYVIQNLSMHRRDVDKAEAAVLTAQMDSIIATVDPNADETRLSGLINFWYNNAKLSDYLPKEINYYGYTPAMYAIIDSVLDNEANKKSLYSTLGNMFFMYQPSDSAITAFMEQVEPYIANAPMIKKTFQNYIDERAKIIKDGDAIPCDAVLITPDGTKTTLFEQLQGKVVYIDFWATWCGPCCREIPFMEKLVEQFKGNEEIRFLSISCDEDLDAWHEKLKKDNPDWPQFVFTQKSNKEFCEAMQINGIPRFIIVGRDGKLISANAARPSNKDIVSILNTAIENK